MARILTELTLCKTAITSEGLKALAASPLASRLKFLDISNLHAWDEVANVQDGLKAIASSTQLSDTLHLRCDLPSGRFDGTLAEFRRKLTLDQFVNPDSGRRLGPFE